MWRLHLPPPRQRVFQWKLESTRLCRLVHQQKRASECLCRHSFVGGRIRTAARDVGNAAWLEVQALAIAELQQIGRPLVR